MNGIQLDLFTFAAMQCQEQPINTEPVIVLKNFVNDGKYPLPTAKSERIAANLKAIRLLKPLSENSRYLRFLHLHRAAHQHHN